MQRITILSGKGGTGKTSIAASLSVLLARNKKLIAIDCDTDAPNLGLILGIKNSDFRSWNNVQTNEKASLIEERCTGCKKCVNTCNFGAIEWDSKKNVPIFDKFLCEGCGACALMCPEKAIKLEKVNNGRIGVAISRYGFKLVSGQLEVGETGTGKIVTLIKNKAEEIAKREKVEIIIADSAAGIGCPVVASVQGSDYTIVVTEPTPSAMSDLKRAVSLVEYFKIPYGIIINKYDLNKSLTRKIELFAEKRKVPLLGKIRYNKKFVDAVVSLKPIVVYDKTYKSLFSDILNAIELFSKESFKVIV